MNPVIKHMLAPFRKLAARFVDSDVINSNNSTIYKAANLIAAEKIEGDYLEFGVFTGISFTRAYHVLSNVFAQHQKLDARRTASDIQETRQVWEKMRFFAFDSFQGLPELEGVDKATSGFAAGQYRYPESTFRENLMRSRVPLDKVVTVAGWFEHTCTTATMEKLNMKQAAIIHVDCDLYASARVVLEFVEPLLADGTVIIFNDWFCFRGNPNLGEQRAFTEWKARMTDWTFVEYHKEGPWSNSFIASRHHFS